MLLKYCAIILLLFISFYIAFLIRKRSNEKIVLLEELCFFIEYIGNQIEFFCTPTEEIISSYRSNYLEKYGFLPLKCEENWEEKLKKCHMISYLDADTFRHISNFGNRLGRSSCEEQITNCKYTLKILRERLDEDKCNIPKKAKVYSALCVVSGFMAAILII